MRTAGSQDVPGPDSRDAQGEVLPGAASVRQARQAHRVRLGRAGQQEARVRDHLGELGLRREALDRLHQVLVRVAVAHQHVAEWRQHVERVLPVQLREDRQRDLAELEAGKDAARLQHAERLGDHAVNVRAVADAERNRVEVDRLAQHRLAHQRRHDRVPLRTCRRVAPLGHGQHAVQRLGVAELEADLRRIPIHGGLEPLLALDQHLVVNVQHRHGRLAVQVLGACVVQDAQSNVARAARHVETVDPAPGVQHLDKVVLPEPVNPE